MEQAFEPRAARIPMRGTVSYTSASGSLGQARWMDASWNGARLRLGRYLRPGQRIQLNFESEASASGLACAEARVMWCQPQAESVEFDAGLHVLLCEPAPAWTFSALLAQARANGRALELREWKAAQDWTTEVQAGPQGEQAMARALVRAV